MSAGAAGILHQSLRRLREQLELSGEFSETLQLLDTRRPSGSAGNETAERPKKVPEGKAKNGAMATNLQEKSRQASEKGRDKREAMGKMRKCQSTDQYRRVAVVIRGPRGMAKRAMAIEIGESEEEEEEAREGTEGTRPISVAVRWHAEGTEAGRAGTGESREGPGQSPAEPASTRTISNGSTRGKRTKAEDG